MAAISVSVKRGVTCCGQFQSYASTVYMVAQHLAAGRLKTILAAYENPPVPIHVIHHEGRQATRKVRAFLDLAIEMLRADGALN
jgi:DNA-binding transcriptional LysR family regulator